MQICLYNNARTFYLKYFLRSKLFISLQIFFSLANEFMFRLMLKLALFLCKESFRDVASCGWDLLMHKTHLLMRAYVWKWWCPKLWTDRTLGLSRITTREESFKGKDSVSLPFFSLRIFMKCVFMLNYERVGLGRKIKISLDIAILLALLKRVCKCVLIFLITLFKYYV